MTELNDCFDVNDELCTIRLKGTRIGWEHVIQLYQRGFSADEIAEQYPMLQIGQVYAAITRFLLNRSEYEAYIRRGDEIAKELRERYEASLTPEQRAKQEAMRERMRSLKKMFTDSNGRLDQEGLKEYLAREKAAAEVSA